MMAPYAAIVAPGGAPDIWKWAYRSTNDPGHIYFVAMSLLEQQLRTAGYWTGKLGTLHMPAVDSSDPGDWIIYGTGGKPRGELVHSAGFGAQGNGEDAGWDFDEFFQNLGNVTSTSYLVGAFQSSNTSGITPIFSAFGPNIVRLSPRVLTAMSFFPGTGYNIEMTVENAYGFKGYARTSDTAGYFINFPANVNPSLVRTITNDVGAITPHGNPVSKPTGLYTGTLFSTATAGAWIIGAAPDSTAQAEAIARAFDYYFEVVGTKSQIYVPGAPPYSGDGGFARDEINDVTPTGLEVMRLSAPPVDEFQTHQRQFDVNGVQTYAPFYGFPATHYMTRPWTAFGREATASCVEIIWVDRSYLDNDGNPTTSRFKKPNDTMGLVFNGNLRCGAEFTSYTKAIYSTLVKLAWSAGIRPRNDPNLVILGTPTGWLDLADQGGFDTSGWDAIVSGSPDVDTDPNIIGNTNIYTGPAGGLVPGSSAILHQAYCAANISTVFSTPAYVFPNWRTSKDIIILGQLRSFDSVNMKGFLIDDEAADARSIAEKSFLMDMISRIAKAKKTAPLVPRFPVLWNSNHDLGTQLSRLSGWDESNAWAIHQKFDGMSLAVGLVHKGPVAERLDPQVAFIGAGGPVDTSRLFLTVGVGVGQNQTTLEEADQAQAYMVANNINGIFVVNAGATPVAPRSGTYNQILARWLGLPLTAP